MTTLRTRQSALVTLTALLLLPVAARAQTLTNGNLTVVIRADNGAIDAVEFDGVDFYNPGGPISDWGFQKDTQTLTFVRQRTDGGGDLSVTVTSGGGTVGVSGTYTDGGADVDFVRTYELVAGSDVLQITTDFVNNGSDVTLSYYDTFDPDQGEPQGLGFDTYNDVVDMVARASATDDLTVVMGSTDAEATVAAGGPFAISDGDTLNQFFDNPVDGNGALADQGIHVGTRFLLPSGATDSFVYHQSYGVTAGAAEASYCAVAGLPDADGDGSCVLDNCPSVPNSGQEDADGDGNGDACDVCFGSGSDDADVDGFCDGEDNCPLDANPGQEDFNSDGDGDVCDDSDGDGVLDAGDNCVLAANAGQDDGDADGVGDVCDNCPADANPGQEESESLFVVLDPPTYSDELDSGASIFSGSQGPFIGDNVEFSCGTCATATFVDAVQVIGAGYDLCGYSSQVPRRIVENDDKVCARSLSTLKRYDIDLLSHASGSTCIDDDGGVSCAAAGGYNSYRRGISDGFGDECDNCDLVANPGQEDADSDDIGDPCEDDDGDGVINGLDNCPADANPTQADNDGDGVGDVCDACLGAGTSDSDSDGLCDGDDNCPFVANPGQEDFNGDGQGDVCDDSDGDGTVDADDNCLFTPNASQSDADADGPGDACDNCPADPNPSQEDVDGDDIGDVCDSCFGIGTADTDGDGLCDGEDNCPFVANPAQEDFNGDGQGDVCDDSDGDGTVDVDDNCLLEPNATQDDADADGFGDVCDNCPADANSAQGDADEDGAGQVCDNCPAAFNPDQQDTDGDTDGDVCDPDDDGDGDGDDEDNCPLDANPGQEDAEEDGVGDACDNCPADPNPRTLAGLEEILARLDVANAAISALVPTRFDFTEGATGSSIQDGGLDMYDVGNSLGTELDALPYTNGVVTAADARLGPGSRYFTAKYTGLFVMAATGIDVGTFEIGGDTGADGNGSVNGVVLHLTIEGTAYTAFVKRVFNAGDPSINHIVIVPGDGIGISHDFPNNTNDDRHTVTGLSAVDEVYYLLVSRQGGLKLEDPDIEEIVEAFVKPLSEQGDADDDGIGDVCDECLLLDCDDGDPCTNDVCDPLLGCTNALEPRSACAPAGRVRIAIADSDDDGADRLTWKWARGPAIEQAELGSPNTTTAYTMCVFDTTGAAPTLAARLDIPAGSLWRSKAPRGWSYNDAAAAADGVRSCRLRAGAAGGTKAVLKAQGLNIPMPAPASTFAFFEQDPRVTVQLVASDASACYRSDFTFFQINDGAEFKAKAP